ncbi:hypothetical protein [Mesorhizobium sp. M0435]|uniref:hypothetical protein n=1 Tax=unclassified Mesorhizobium TaxID=325217 RepID=UPI00333D027D
MAHAQQELVEFVISKAFNPVMRAKPDGKSDAERKMLEHVQQATKTEIERYRGYSSAEEAATNFKRDLNSDAAKKLHAQLRRLHLPTIEDIRDDFEDKAHELGVKASP